VYFSLFNALQCPLDGEPLQPYGQSWVCAQRHSFDTAKQGYVNVLPVQQKRSKDPGDSKAMVVARQEFLNAGYYAPIAKAITSEVQQLLAKAGANQPFRVLDAGCGEGYYLRALQQGLLANASAGHEVQLVGLDISKWAVLAAAKQSRNAQPLQWLVASNASLPVASGSIHALLCVFGFPVAEEFRRVLAPSGCVITVDPTGEHLRELREVVYSEVQQRNDNVRQFAGLTEASSSVVTAQVHLPNPAAISQLFSMTPHFYRAPAAGKARVAALTELRVTVSVRITQWC
jgi:23S rRNA (guanine745-N1)-methyltransferase